MVSLNAEIRKDVVVQVDVVDCKILTNVSRGVVISASAGWVENHLDWYAQLL